MRTDVWWEIGGRVKRCWRALADSCGGAVAIATALASLIAAMLIALGVDYTRAATLRLRMQAAADAAALAGLNRSLLTRPSSDSRMTAYYEFVRNFAPTNAVKIEALEIVAGDSNGRRELAMELRASIQANLSRLLGIHAFPVTINARGTGTLAVYSDLYLLIDNSPSMGIGATERDMAVMSKAISCVFACHRDRPGEDELAIAKRAGAVIRLDMAIAAAQALIDRVVQISVVPDQYRVAVYTYGTKCPASRLTPWEAPASSLFSRIRGAIGYIQLAMTPDGFEGGCSNPVTMLAEINRQISQPGDGMTPSTPQKTLFWITDGLTDSDLALDCADYGGYRCFQPLKQGVCNDIKARNVKVAVLYTTYLPLDDPGYRTVIAPFAGQIGPRLRECASEGLFFEARSGDELAGALTRLFESSIRSAQLTR